MDKTNHISTLTTIGIDRQTGKLIDKLCKRYSLKKGEIVRLAFVYIDKACINPSEAPESVKSELAKINKRQDDIIRFIRHYEEEQLNPMIRAANSIAVRFDAIGKELENLILSQLAASQERQTAVLQKVSEQFGKHADVINQQGKQLTALYQIHQRDYKKNVPTDTTLFGVINLWRDGRQTERELKRGNRQFDKYIEPCT